jgi:2-polyprenyl-3-methyl-5-hydroxy-6-metoxy-1,4-benzoquinol methylase
MSEGAYSYLDVPRADMVAFIPQTARVVLDVGCGRGGFGAELKRQRPNIRVIGIEADPDAAASAHERYDHVVVGLYPDNAPPGPYDCIVFNDVLEHMVDPWGALSDSRHLLAETGHVVASIPNVRYWPVLRALVYGDFAYTSDGVLDRTHLRFFTRRSMHRLFADAGLQVERLVPISLLALDQVSRRERTLLRVLRRVRPRLVGDLRAQQYAVVGSYPKEGRQHSTTPERAVDEA